MCDHKETYIGKTVGDNVVRFKSRINQHISVCRTGTSTCKFPIHLYQCTMKNNPAGMYLLKVSNRNTRTRCETCSKLTIKIPERRHVIVGWEMFKRTIFN